MKQALLCRSVALLLVPCVAFGDLGSRSPDVWRPQSEILQSGVRGECFAAQALASVSAMPGESDAISKTASVEVAKEAFGQEADAPRSAVTLRLTTQAHLDDLTPREIDVLALYGRGWSQEEIGDKLRPKIRRKTVDVHLDHLRGKIGIKRPKGSNEHTWSIVWRLHHDDLLPPLPVALVQTRMDLDSAILDFAEQLPNDFRNVFEDMKSGYMKNSEIAENCKVTLRVIEKKVSVLDDLLRDDKRFKKLRTLAKKGDYNLTCKMMAILAAHPLSAAPAASKSSKIASGSAVGLYLVLRRPELIAKAKALSLKKIVRLTTGGRGPGGHLSPGTVRRDLSILLRYGLVESIKKGARKVNKAVDMRMSQVLQAGRILLLLGTRPNGARIALGLKAWKRFMAKDIETLFKNVNVIVRDNAGGSRTLAVRWNPKKRQLHITWPRSSFTYFQLLEALPLDFVLSAEFNSAVMKDYYGRFGDDDRYADPVISGWVTPISVNAYVPQLREYLVRQVDALGPWLRILSIGPHNGSLENILRSHGHSLVGADLAPGKGAKSLSEGVVLLPADAQALPFVENSFDLVLFPETLGHMNIPAALREAYRVLRPNGKLIVLHQTKMMSGVGWALGRAFYKILPLDIVSRAMQAEGFDVLAVPVELPELTDSEFALFTAAPLKSRHPRDRHTERST